MNRYDTTKRFINNSDEYEEYFLEKQIAPQVQMNTLKIKDFQQSDLSLLNFIYHTYRIGEKMYNISNKYYGNPNYGWLILLTNKLDSDFKLYDGIKLKIYLPFESILGASI